MRLFVLRWRVLPAVLAVIFILLGSSIVTANPVNAQATPVVDTPADEGPEEPADQESDFSAAAVTSTFFDETTYIFLKGTSRSATFTIVMTGTTVNGTAELFGTGSAVPVAPAHVEGTSGDQCVLNQEPTGGTVQVLFGSTGGGTCVIHFTIGDVGLPQTFGTVYANVQVNFIPRPVVTADVEFVRPLEAGTPTINVPFGQPHSGTLPATGGKLPYDFTLLTQPSAGSVALDNAATGAFSFTPDAGQFGTYSFDYQVEDSTDIAQTATGTVTLVIAPPPVVASNGTLAVPYEGQADGTLIATGGGGSLTYSEVDAPDKGTVTIDPVTGTYTYMANPGETGNDTFSFRATDGSLPPLSSTGTITVTIAPPTLTTTNLDLDVAFEGDVSDTITASGGTPPLAFGVGTQPLKGTVDLDPATGAFTYTAGAGQTGSDSFTVTISDNGTSQQSVTSTVMLTIGPEPLATGDLDLTVAFAGSVDAIVSQTGGTLPVTFSVTGFASKGAVDLDPATGAFTYTAGPNETGTDSFVIALTDSGSPAQVATATVTVTIGAPDQLTATTLTLTVEADESVLSDLNASVSGGFPPYTFTVGTLPTQGTLVLSPEGIFTYTANSDASGTDSFTYTVADSEQPSVTAAATTQGTVLITIVAAEPTPTPTMTPDSTPSPTPTIPDAEETSTPSPTEPGTGKPTVEPTGESTADPDPIRQLPSTGQGGEQTGSLMWVLGLIGLILAMISVRAHLSRRHR